MMSALLDEALTAGVELGYGEVDRVRPERPLQLGTPEGEVTAGALVVATGLSDGRLGLSGEDAFVGRGVSTRAGCDGPLFTGKEVAVVGSNEWTAEEALELAGFASKVTVLVPGEPRWSAGRGQRLVDSDRIELRVGTSVASITGDGSVSGVVLRTDDEATELSVSGVFPYVGRRGESGLLRGALATDQNGRLPADGDLRTDLPGVFVAGDVRPGSVPWLVCAAADGVRAGRAAAASLPPDGL